MEFNLLAGEIHIWDASLDRPAAQWHSLAELLSADELTRAAAYHFERDQRRFTVARGVLRILLGHYLNINPRAVKFAYSPKDKPSVVGHPSLQFNVSHSHELAVYAFGNDQPLGIDLEHLRLVTDMYGIARSNFSARENAVFGVLAEHLQQEAFFNCWTRKEAFIKALGEGLSHPLDSFEVTLAPNDPARLVNVLDHPDEAAQWSLYAFHPQVHYVGALAVRQTIKPLKFQHWDFAS